MLGISRWITGTIALVVLLLFAGHAQVQESLPEGIDSNWWSQVQKDIAASEYEIRWQPEHSEYQSPNRAQNLRFSYYLDGFRVKPRIEGDLWSVDVRLTGFGREGSMVPFEGGTIAIDKRKGYVEGNGVDIVYEHSEKGMSEDFVVQDGITGDGGLILEFLVFRKNIKMAAKEDEIDFVIDESGGAEVFRYCPMKVTDGGGKILKGYFRMLTEDRFAIVVEDQNAEYPIRIDPFSPIPDWTAESNQAYARFGISVSTAGDVNGDGYSDVIIGADLYDNGQANEGRAFVYHGSAEGLSTAPDWTAESDQIGALFGISVSTAGDMNGDGYSDVIIGASHYDNGQLEEGRAYVYHGSASGLSTTPDWTAESDQMDAWFGYSVSIAGDVNSDGFSDVIISAHYFDNGQIDEGRAYVYHGSAEGLSTAPDWIVESDQESALFGISVSKAGDMNGDGYSDVIIGASGYDHGQPNEGRAFVYHGSASGLSPTPDWTAESDQMDAYFGYPVSTAGDVNGDGFSDVIIGASYYDNGQIDEGRAFVYHGSAGGISTAPDWTAESDQTNAWFSYAAASTAGDVNGDGYSDVIIGAYGYDNGQINEGRAFLYLGSVSGLSTTPEWTAESEQTHANFGISVSTAGDVNGDGFSDVIIGAHAYDYGQIDGGRVFVYHGSVSGLSTTPAIKPSPRLKLTVAYVPGGVLFRCSRPAGLDDGSLVIYNLLGAEIDRVELSLHDTGEYRLEWRGQGGNGAILPSGVYFARIESAGYVSNTAKFVWIR